ncbi:hypothetical protein D3C83_230420 [compost metagenome]
MGQVTCTGIVTVTGVVPAMSAAVTTISKLPALSAFTLSAPICSEVRGAETRMAGREITAPAAS